VEKGCFFHTVERTERVLVLKEEGEHFLARRRRERRKMSRKLSEVEWKGIRRTVHPDAASGSRIGGRKKIADEYPRVISRSCSLSEGAVLPLREAEKGGNHPREEKRDLRNRKRQRRKKKRGG